MTKKLLALLLAVLLCLSAAACTPQTPSTDGTDTSTESATETESESATETESESATETETETETDKSDLPEDDSVLLPEYEGSNTLIDFTDTYNDCILMTVQGTTKADYEAYLAKLASFSNYEEIVAPRKVLGSTNNLSSIYTKEIIDSFESEKAVYQSLEGEENHDLIVCGAGMSGFGAALAAAEEGLRVLLIERGTRS